MRTVLYAMLAAALGFAVVSDALACSRMKSVKSTSERVMDMASADQATTGLPMTPKTTTTSEKK